MHCKSLWIKASDKCKYHLVFIFVIIFFYFLFLFLVFIIIVYFTSFYVKHFELPLCMKCAI